MKLKLFFSVLLLFSIQLLAAQLRSNKDLIGKWSGADKGQQLQLEFFANATVMITTEGGRLPLATYTANFNTMPIEVKLTATDHGQQMNFKGQLTFIDNRTIKLTYFGDNKRNDVFAEGRTITMQKM
ncbi:MAG: hypothetical protein JST81_00280 [Bacteroidetes bacterium]|nr:hypothetical protein [Bacteroidota bacterium]